MVYVAILFMGFIYGMKFKCSREGAENPFPNILAQAPVCSLCSRKGDKRHMTEMGGQALSESDAGGLPALLGQSDQVDMSREASGFHQLWNSTGSFKLLVLSHAKCNFPTPHAHLRRLTLFC